MGGKVKATKAEKMMVVLTVVFLCALLGLFLHDRSLSAAPGLTVETERTVPREELAPDISPLDLNTATAEELAALPGIGETLAARILEYRADNGPFESVEELTDVSGIGEGKLAGLEGWVTVK